MGGVALFLIFAWLCVVAGSVLSALFSAVVVLGTITCYVFVIVVVLIFKFFVWLYRLTTRDYRVRNTLKLSGKRTPKLAVKSLFNVTSLHPTMLAKSTPNNCLICGRDFTTVRGLATHDRMKHSKEAREKQLIKMRKEEARRREYAEGKQVVLKTSDTEIAICLKGSGERIGYVPANCVVAVKGLFHSGRHFDCSVRRAKLHFEYS